MRYVELFYPDLHVEFDYGPTDWETGAGTQLFEKEIEYTYRADRDLVENVIANSIPIEQYVKITTSAPDYDKGRDDADIFYEYIRNNFNRLLNQYKDQVLEAFREDAEDEAAATIDPEDYDNFDENLSRKSDKMDKKIKEDFDPLANMTWSKEILNKFDYLRTHETYNGSFSRGAKVWDLDLTDKQEDYFYEFIESGLLDRFWKDNKDLAKDIYQEGRMGGHLVLGDSYSSSEPDYYDADRFQFPDIDDCFADWVLENYNVSITYFEDEDEFEEAKAEFEGWINDAYEAVTGFDERVDELIGILKQTLDDFAEKEEAPSEDLTKTMFSDVEDIEEPKLSGPKYDEIDESYFDSPSKYLVVDVDGSYLNDFEDEDQAIDWAESHWKAFEVQEVADSSVTTVWRRIGFPDGDDEDDFDECYDDASDELPELDEAVDFNPDFDDDFAGHHYTSYDLYRAEQEINDEEAFNDRDPNRYDAAHAKEWMERHPYGWYNSESDYGIGDPDYDNSPEFLDDDLNECSSRPTIKEELNGKILEFECGKYFTVEKRGNKLIAGSTTNTEIIPEFEIDFDEDKSEDENLQDLYDKIVEEHPEFLSAACDESLSECATPVQRVADFKRISKRGRKAVSQPAAAKKLAESATPESDIRKAVSRFYKGHYTDSFFNLVVDLVDRTISNLEVEDHTDTDLYQAVMQAIDEGLVYTSDQWEVIHHYCVPSNADLDIAIEGITSDVAKITDEIKNLHYYDESCGSKRGKNLEEGAMSELDLDIEEAGSQDELIEKIKYEITKLRREQRFLISQAPREIGKGGNFDSQSDIDDALRAVERALSREEAKLAIVRGKQNG